MLTKLGTKLRSLSAVQFGQNLRWLSSIDDASGHSYSPPEPIPDRPLRGQSNPSRNPRFPKPNRVRDAAGSRSSFRGNSDADFLERFKLGFDRGSETGDGSSVDKSVEPEKSEKTEALSPPEDAEEIFRKMKETGLIPNAVAMLDGLCKDGLVQDALKLFGLMREKGSIPEVVVYTAVVEGFCKAHKLDDAIRVFRKMQSNGVTPNAFTYQVLIQGLTCGKRLEDSFGFAVEMLEAGFSPNLATFTALVDGYCKEKGLEEAKSLVEQMKQKGFYLDGKAAREYLDKKGPFTSSVWEAILGKKDHSMSLFEGCLSSMGSVGQRFLEFSSMLLSIFVESWLELQISHAVNVPSLGYFPHTVNVPHAVKIRSSNV